MNVSEAMNVIGKNLAEDDDYAIGWKSNLAMMYYDAMPYCALHVDELRKVCNDAADRFIKAAFDVDTSHLCK